MQVLVLVCPSLDPKATGPSNLHLYSMDRTSITTQAIAPSLPRLRKELGDSQPPNFAPTMFAAPRLLPK